MSLIIMTSAAARRAEDQKNKEEVKELSVYVTSGTILPDSAYRGYFREELSKQGKTLLKSLQAVDKNLPEPERRTLIDEKIAEFIQKDLVAKKYALEGDRGWSKDLARMPREIQGDTVKLSLLNEKDAQSLYKLLQDNSEILKNAVTNPGVLPTSLEESSNYIKTVNNLFKQNAGYAYGVKANYNTLVGEVQLAPIRKYVARIYEMGFRIGEKYGNKGYMKQSAKILMDTAFTELAAEFVVINTNKNNDAANALAKTLGYTLEPHNMNHESDKNTWSKSTQGKISSLLLGKKLVTKLKDSKLRNL